MREAEDRGARRQLRKFPAIAGHQQAWEVDWKPEGELFPLGPHPAVVAGTPAAPLI